MIKIGYKASAEQFGPAELMRYAILAEHAGFDSVFVSDHFQPWRHTGGHAPFSLSWLGALAASTSRVQMGTSVLTPTFRYHPSIIAHAFGTLGSMFPGRLILGAGTGESLNEVPATGMNWPEAKERTARLRESVTLIRRLWSEDRVTFHGEYFKTENATIYDKPEKMVPIYIAGAGPVISKYAGSTGDGFICTSGKSIALYTDTLLPSLDAGIAAAHRDPAQVERMIEVKVSFDTEINRAMADTRYWAALALSPEEKMSVEDPLQMERLADAVPAERAAKRWIVTTDPDDLVDRIGLYVNLGFRHLVFHFPGPNQARILKLCSELVLPRIRKRWN